MRSEAKTVEEYIAGLPDDRQEPIKQLVDLVRQNLPEGYEEVMEWGMVTYQVPLSVYPDTYNKKPLMYAAVASQKNHMAIYVTAPYANYRLLRQLEDGFRDAGKKLDMGASCIRFKDINDIPLDVIGKVIAAVSVDEHVKSAKQARSAQK